MTRERIRTPTGRNIRHGPDRLKAMLAQRVAEAPPLIDIPESIESPTPASASYATESFDSRAIVGAEVTVLGAGSVGSHCTSLLAPAQLRINCLDDKRVQPRHTQGGRTIYDPSQIGLHKVDALRAKVMHNWPGTTIIPLAYKTSEIPDAELLDMFARSLAVVLAMDDPEEIPRVARLAYPVTDLVQIAMHAQAASGHIALSIPFVTPCWACTMGISDTTPIHRLDSEAGSAWDIIAVAQTASNVIIDLLFSRRTGQPITRWDVSKNLIYISNTTQEISPDGPGITYEGSRKRPLCPICHNLP